MAGAVQRALTAILLPLAAGGPAAAQEARAGADAIQEVGPALWSGCVGKAACTVGIGALTLRFAANGGVLAMQIDEARGAVPGLGVDRDPGNGFNEGEIQGPVAGQGGERMTISIDPPMAIREIALAHLFSPSEVEADPEETALIEGFAGGRSAGRITVSHLRGGALALDGPAEGARIAMPGAGVIALARPFAGRAVERIELTAAPVESGDSSDYSLAGIALAPAEER